MIEITDLMILLQLGLWYLPINQRTSLQSIFVVGEYKLSTLLIKNNKYILQISLSRLSQ